MLQGIELVFIFYNNLETVHKPHLFDKIVIV